MIRFITSCHRPLRSRCLIVLTKKIFGKNESNANESNESNVFCTKTKFCFLIVLVILLAIILAASLRRKDEEADEGLKLAGKKLDIPKHYCVVRASKSLYKETISFKTNGEEICHVQKCSSCETIWTFYLINTEDEIAVIVERESSPWADTYHVQEQWKINATSYKIEYSWSGLEMNEDIYVIKNSKGFEIARSEQFPLEFGKTLTLIDANSNSTLGRVERTTFDLFLTWKISVYRTDILSTYLYGVLATITTLKEVDVDDDD